MEEVMSYYLKKNVSMSFEKALERVKEELQKEGFGILTEIDVRETLKKKLDVDFRKYRILGACNPKFAHQALQEEARIGLLLPCNVIVQESSDKDVVEVAAIDPAASMQTVANPRLDGIALQVQAKLQKVIAAL
jgi:uncharacterized protein (DUF302 family)